MKAQCGKEKQCGKKSGFTLVELIVVLVILAILAALLIPSLTGYIDKAKKAAVRSEARTVRQAFQAAFAEEYANGFSESAAVYTIDGVKNYFAYTNFALIHYNDPKMSDKSSQRIAQNILQYLDDDNFYSDGASNYVGQTAKVASTKLGDKYALIIVADTSGHIVELDYMHNGYLYIYQNGNEYVYDSTDNTHGFCKKVDNVSNHTITLSING